MEPVCLTRRRSAPRRARAGLAAALTLAVALSAAPVVGGAASAADPARAVADARHAVDRLANEYFSAQRHLAELDASITAIDARIAGARGRAAASRALAMARAAAMYRSAGADAIAVDPGANTLTAARRVTLMDAANEVAQRDIDRYTTAASDLRHARAAIDKARAAQRRLLASLTAQRATLDARLAAVQQAYRADLAARQAAAAREAAAKAAAAHQATTSTKHLPSTSGTSPPTSGPTPRPVSTPAPPPPQPGTNSHHSDPFLSCVRQRESGGNYGAVSGSGYYGAYQFSASTWDVTASHAGRLALVGVRPDRASAWDQDDMAWTLYQWQGAAPWGGGCP